MRHLKIKDINEIISLSRYLIDENLQAQIEARPPKASSNELYEISVEEEKLYNKVNSLSKNALNELCALMWLGRGYGDEKGQVWGELIKSVPEETHETKVLYIINKTPLSDYLEVGLEKYRKS